MSSKISTARTQRDDALEGSFGFGGADTRSLLGRLAAQLPQVVDAIPEFLVTVANDARMPAEHQLGALEGLRRAHAGPLLPMPARGH